MSEYKICTVCGIKYFVDPKKKRGRKQKYDVCPYCRNMNVSRSKWVAPVKEKKSREYRRVLTAPQMQDPEEEYPVITTKDYKCKRFDCTYRSSDRTNGTCDYCLIEHRARHLICSVKECTVYKPGKRPRTSPM